MEANGEANIGSLLDKIQPPRLEDAGLEDCALPPDSIHEAFLKAATAVRSRIFHTSDDELEGECVNDPWPGNESSDDKLSGITTEAILQERVLRRKAVNYQLRPQVPDEPEKSCVDGLQGLQIGEKKGKGEINGKKSEASSEPNKNEEDDEKI